MNDKINKMEQQQKWRKLDGTRIRIPIEDEVRAVIVKEKESGHHLKVCIGTDSQVKGKETESSGFAGDPVAYDFGGVNAESA